MLPLAGIHHAGKKDGQLVEDVTGNA